MIYKFHQAIAWSLSGVTAMSIDVMLVPPGVVLLEEFLHRSAPLPFLRSERWFLAADAREP
jgi:hypothetical protein